MAQHQTNNCSRVSQPERNFRNDPQSTASRARRSAVTHLRKLLAFRLARHKQPGSVDLLGTFWAQTNGVNPSVETKCNWHTCRLMNFSSQTASSPSEWSSAGEAEAGSGGDQPAKE